MAKDVFYWHKPFQLQIAADVLAVASVCIKLTCTHLIMEKSGKLV